ncbi:50S ribosomal protein L32 [Candidatus Desantisbacteria bacterium]|nr:50S ribosomal protein L32 [Candidatus Desantisbacteria bacterium]
MAVPKRKPSKSRRKTKRMHLKASAPAKAICPQCKEQRLPHHVCPNCGYYNGKEVIKDKTKEDQQQEKDK